MKLDPTLLQLQGTNRHIGMSPPMDLAPGKFGQKWHRQYRLDTLHNDRLWNWKSWTGSIKHHVHDYENTLTYIYIYIYTIISIYIYIFIYIYIYIYLESSINTDMSGKRLVQQKHDVWSIFSAISAWNPQHPRVFTLWCLVSSSVAIGNSQMDMDRCFSWNMNLYGGFYRENHLYCKWRFQSEYIICPWRLLDEKMI